MTKKVPNYSALRKRLQKEGEIPEWFTTGGTQLFYDRYSYEEESVKSRYKTIAKTMAKHAPKVYPDFWDKNPYTKGKDWEEVFFNAMWDGLISPSTPMLANAGIRKRGTTVACSGGYVGNNLYDRYNAITEAAILTKHSHGTSYSIQDWPHEGAKLARGGRSLGTAPLVTDFISCMDQTTQGQRRGSLAYSISPDHGDFEWILNLLKEDPESNHVGWLITDDFNNRLNAEDEDTISKVENILDVKLPVGKGYFTFIDKCQRHLAEPFKKAGLSFKASNLCQETILPADENYTYSCVILNYNLELYDIWPEDLVFIGQVMSDCNVSEYLECIEDMTPMDQAAMAKIKRFTEEFRALGSGVLGFHTLLQHKRIVVGDLESFALNEEIFKGLDIESRKATEWLAEVLGEPEGCKGFGIRNATRLMMPPTKSTAEIMAGASEGIGLDTAMVFTKTSAGGELYRINKVLLGILKERGVYNPETLHRISVNRSVSEEPYLSDHEKAVFRTAFEIPMESHLALCSQRQPYIDQGQSINLYLTSNDTEEYISRIHKTAFNDENIKTLYYLYSMRNAGNIERADCIMCQ